MAKKDLIPDDEEEQPEETPKKKQSFWNRPLWGGNDEPKSESPKVKKESILNRPLWGSKPLPPMEDIIDESDDEPEPRPAPKSTKQVMKDAEEEIKKTDDLIAEGDKLLPQSYTKPAAAAPPQPPAHLKPLSTLKCNACGTLIPIYTKERPLRTTCPMCGRQSTHGTAPAKLKKVVKTPKAEGNVIAYLRSAGLDAAAEGEDKAGRKVLTIYDDEKALTIFSDGSSKYLIIDAEKKQVCTAIKDDNNKYRLIAAYSMEGISKLIGYTTAKPAEKGDFIRMLYNTGDFLGTAREGNIVGDKYPHPEESPAYPAMQSRLEEIIKKIPQVPKK